MPRIKLTKNELKAQRDSLRRYERYLPTLQLKKQQLQLELRLAEQRLQRSVESERAIVSELEPWIALFADPEDLTPYLALQGADTEEGNIAGVPIPVLKDVRFTRTTPDLFATPAWIDEALEVLERLVRLRIEREVFEEQKRRLAAELRTTNQRVNLFERVKIPECREAIRRIRICLGDLMTLDVARGKIAKSKSLERETAT